MFASIFRNFSLEFDGWLWLKVQFGVWPCLMDGCGYRYSLELVVATGTGWRLALLDGRLWLQVQFGVWPCLMDGCGYRYSLAFGPA